MGNLEKGNRHLPLSYESSKRLKNGDTILYFGDHDATGIDIDRSLQDSFLNNHSININVKRIGLVYDDIEKYNLLPNPIKETDPRATKKPQRAQRTQRNINSVISEYSVVDYPSVIYFLLISSTILKVIL